MEEIRLNKYLSQMGICSRREADRLIEAGKVLVDGKTAIMGMKIKGSQTVICDGQRVGGIREKGNEKDLPKPKPVLLAVNKPRGVVCTTSNKDRAVNIVEMVKYPERVYPVGRLDKESEGLIFLTNQGDLVNRIMRSSNNHEKEYVVQVNKKLTEEFAKKMEAGIWLKELDATTKPCRVIITGQQEFHMILTQGLNRQIRRMCDTLGYGVCSLRRIRIMNVHLGNLKAGTFRKVTAQEYKELTEMLERN